MTSLQHNLRWLNKNGKVLFWSFACLLLLLLTGYVYLINTTTQNGVRWGKTEQTIASLGAKVSELESRYLSLKQSVTLSMAYARGFEDVKAVKFISARKIGTVATSKDI